MLNVVGLWFINIAALLAGMVIFAYWSRCDPLIMGRIEKTDQYFPYFVVTELSKYPGITGLHVSSVYAGSLSTVSSGINAMSMCTIEDFIRPWSSWSEKVCIFPNEIYMLINNIKSLTTMSMLFVLFYGFLSIAMAYLASKFGPILQASLSILGKSIISSYRTSR